MGRNVTRISKEYKKYSYNPMKKVFYNVEDAYFDLNKKMEKLKVNYNNCNTPNMKCNKNDRYDVKIISNIFIFFLKK